MFEYETHTLLIWADGLLYRSLDEALAQSLQERGIEGVNLYAGPDYLYWREQLTLGMIDKEIFFEDVSASMTSVPDADFGALQEDVSALMTSVPDALFEACMVKSDLIKRLVVDIPEDWFMQLPCCNEVMECFPPGSLIFLEKSGLPRLLPDVFYYLSCETGTPLEHCLLLDHDRRRPIWALRHGMPADEITNTMRLKREFLMRGLTDEDYCMHERPT